MSSELQQVIDAARALSLRDKLELLQIIARDLQKVEAFTEASPAFWSLRSLDAIAQSQSAPVITDVHALAVGFWPEDELADDFNQFIAVRRHADRLRACEIIQSHISWMSFRCIMRV